VAAVGLSLAMALTACSGDDDGGDSRAGGSTDTTRDKAAAPPAPEQFTGAVEDFYKVPDPLPEGEPGDLIRVQDVGDAAGETTLRIMYHSRDAEDRDRAVTGLVTYPTDASKAPADGWPVVAWAHGTTGINEKCAPSRAGGTAPAFGVQGVAVATDYIGLGPVGELHPYLSKPAEGHSSIDAVRAAGRLEAAHAGTSWLSIGHSQGGHAALSAAELAKEYAPELKLLGTVALAPGSDFDKTFGPVDEVVTRVIASMMLFGAPSEHPDLDPDDYAGPGLEAKKGLVTGECLPAIMVPVAGIPADQFWAKDPLTTEPTKSILLANEVGVTKVDAPLLLIVGTADIQVTFERAKSLYRRLCDLGQETELIVLEGADHGGELGPSGDKVASWLQDRLADKPATDSCGTVNP
jgi:pimeloyl-ACP methyl ester carboxylesterase